VTAVEREISLDGLRVFGQADWGVRFPGLVQGITARAPELDFGLQEAAERPEEAAASRTPADGWSRLQAATRVGRVARCRQVHGSAVAVYENLGPAGVEVLGHADALVTGRAGVLLAVTIADCVPVFLLDPERRVLGLAHAGWRGTAAGVVEATFDAMCRLGAEVASLHAHLGPAICGRCYEVGPEVPAALGGMPEGTRFVDLRAHIASTVTAAGVDPERLTASSCCTRCDAAAFFSHRGGDRGRRMCAFLGWPAG